MLIRVFSLLFIFFTMGQLSAQTVAEDSVYMRNHYDMFEYKIPMRDGIKLFTVVYVPKDKTKKFLKEKKEKK